MSEEKKLHPFDQMMLGGRTLKKGATSPSKEERTDSREGGSLLDGVHSIMNSIDELKPLYNKISPLLRQWNIK